MTLEEYLRHTRHLREMSSPESIYRVAQFTNALEASGFSDVHLHITYSTDCVSELVNLDGKLYLVHDRYLGQSLNMLNRIFFHSTELEDAVMYASKVISERLMLAGALRKASRFFAFYRALHENCKSYKSNSNLLWRLFTTQTQEDFVILHELAHYLFYSRQITEDRARKVDNLREFLGEHKTFYQMEEAFVKSFVPELNEEIYVKHRRYDPWDFSDLTPEYLDETICKFPSFAEECLCDEFAVRLLVEKFNKLASTGVGGQGVKLHNALAAVPLFFQHMELLRWLRRVAESAADGALAPSFADDMIKWRVFHFWHALYAQFSDRAVVQVMQRETGRIFSEKFDQILRTPIKEWITAECEA